MRARRGQSAWRIVNRKSQQADGEAEAEAKSIIFLLCIVGWSSTRRTGGQTDKESRQAAACKMSQNLGILKIPRVDEKKAKLAAGCSRVWSMKRMSVQMTDWTPPPPCLCTPSVTADSTLISWNTSKVNYILYTVFQNDVREGLENEPRDSYSALRRSPSSLVPLYHE